MMRTHTCGELRLKDAGKEIVLAGWVQKTRDLGGMTFVDIRDRYGITQIVFNQDEDLELCKKARKLGREYVVSICGLVCERSNKNPEMPTGEIEIKAAKLDILNTSKVPPFTIEKITDGGEDIRMKYRYLDLRRPDIKSNMELRYALSKACRSYLDAKGFIEIETPVLIKTTPEGARDFIVPSRLNQGEFYALPQSPQTFKQLLMVAGFDRYFQLVKCFRDEDLRADRQPEFTQIDCEMSFVNQEDVLNTFEGFIKHIFRKVKDIDLDNFPRMTYQEAMRLYGCDKPDIRFDMRIIDLSNQVKGKGFGIFDRAELVAGIVAPGAASWSRKQIDHLIDYVRTPQVGGQGLVWVKVNEDGSFKSSVDKFYNQDNLKLWQETMQASPGDLLLLMSGADAVSRRSLGLLRLKVAALLELSNSNNYKALWITDFPLVEWSEEDHRFVALHHPFTSPKKEDIPLMDTNPAQVKANAYDLVINGVEIGGGSIRIHERPLQEKMFSLLGFTDEEAKAKFGFLLGAFEYGAPPHGGIAFGFDRLCSMFGGTDSIRDYIAFPKNNAGRDTMLDAPSVADDSQLKELHLEIKKDHR